MNWRGDLTRGQKWAVLWVFACLQIVGLAIHEPWFDELQAWNVVNGSHSLKELIHNLHHENHPLLWYFLLYPISRMWSDPLAMQLFHALIAISSLGLFLRYAPFRGIEKILFSLGHFTLYDYGVVSRNYSLFTLFLWAYVALTVSRPNRLIGRAALLGMAGVSHVLAAIGAIFLAADASVTEWKSKVAFGKERRARIMAAVIAFGLPIIGILQAKPPKGTSYMPGESVEGGLWRIKKALSSLSDALVPIPNLGERGSWYTTWFAESAGVFGQIYLPIILLAVGALVFARAPRRRILFVAFSLILITLSYVTLLVFPRHCGTLFVFGIALLWLEGGFQSSSKRLRQAWVILLVVQAFGGVASYVQDIRHTFSPARAAAAYVRQFHDDGYLISCLMDFPLLAVPAYLEKPIYSYQKEDFQRFVVFNHKEGAWKPPLPLKEPPEEIKSRYRGEILLSTLKLSEEDLDPRIEKPELLKVFDGGLVSEPATRSLYVYRFFYRNR